MIMKGKFVQDRTKLDRVAEPVLEFPDGDGGYFSVYLASKVFIDEHGQLRILKPNLPGGLSKRLRLK
jgi:hypothetical protein